MRVMHELVSHFDGRGRLKRGELLRLLDKGGLATEAPVGGMHGLCDVVGAVYYFRVRGCVEGQIWGSDPYTRDSTMGAAAVHAGLLKPDETAILRVTVVAALDSYPASTRNGVTTQDYGPFPHAWRLSAI